MTRYKRFISLGLLLAVLVLAGCASRNSSDQPDGQTADLANTSWTLVSYGAPGSLIEVLPATQVTLKFDGEGGAGGSSGCNSYGGKYRVEKASVTFSDVFSTLMACTDAGVMDQEQQYLGALQTAGAFELSGDTLTIAYNDGQMALNFIRQN